MPDCWCGIYACKHWEHQDVDSRYGLVGIVALWGRVFEHEDGYRAQYAYPLELWYPWQDEYDAQERFNKMMVPIGNLYKVRVQITYPGCFDERIG